MYAYIEGRRFCKGWLGFKLGRQYVTDVLGWWAFDGGEVTDHDAVLRHGRGLRRPRGARRAAARTLALRGRRRLARRPLGLRPLALPAVPAGRLAPGVRRGRSSRRASPGSTGALTYRRVYDTGAVEHERVRERPLPARRLQRGAHLVRAARLRDRRELAKVGGAKAGVVYDLYTREFALVYASLDALPRARRHGERRLRLLRAVVRRRLDLELLRRRADERRGPARQRGTRPTSFASPPAATRAIYTVQTARGPADGQRRRTSTRATPPYFPSSTPFDDGGGDVTARYKSARGASPSRASGNFGRRGRSRRRRPQRRARLRVRATSSTGAWRLAVGRQACARRRTRRAFSYVLGAGLPLRAALAGARRVRARHQPPRRAALPRDGLLDAGGDEMIARAPRSPIALLVLAILTAAALAFAAPLDPDPAARPRPRPGPRPRPRPGPRPRRPRPTPPASPRSPTTKPSPTASSPRALRPRHRPERRHLPAAADHAPLQPPLPRRQGRGPDLQVTCHKAALTSQSVAATPSSRRGHLRRLPLDRPLEPRQGQGRGRRDGQVRLLPRRVQGRRRQPRRPRSRRRARTWSSTTRSTSTGTSAARSATATSSSSSSRRATSCRGCAAASAATR